MAEEIPEFGRQDGEVQVRDAKPIPFKLVGYYNKDVDDHQAGDEVKILLHARGTEPMGTVMEAMAAAGSGQGVEGIVVARFIFQALDTDEDRRAFTELYDSRDVTMDPEVLGAIFEYLSEKWGGVPFQSRSVRRAGQARRTTASASRPSARRRG